MASHLTRNEMILRYALEEILSTPLYKDAVDTVRAMRGRALEALMAERVPEWHEVKSAEDLF